MIHGSYGTLWNSYVFIYTHVEGHAAYFVWFDTCWGDVWICLRGGRRCTGQFLVSCCFLHHSWCTEVSGHLLNVWLDWPARRQTMALPKLHGSGKRTAGKWRGTDGKKWPMTWVPRDAIMWLWTPSTRSIYSKWTFHCMLVVILLHLVYAQAWGTAKTTAPQTLEKVVWFQLCEATRMMK